MGPEGTDTPCPQAPAGSEHPYRQCAATGDELLVCEGVVARWMAARPGVRRSGYLQKVGDAGLEPATSSLSWKRASQLRQSPKAAPSIPRPRPVVTGCPEPSPARTSRDRRLSSGRGLGRPVGGEVGRSGKPPKRSPLWVSRVLPCEVLRRGRQQPSPPPVLSGPKHPAFNPHSWPRAGRARGGSRQPGSTANRPRRSDRRRPKVLRTPAEIRLRETPGAFD